MTPKAGTHELVIRPFVLADLTLARFSARPWDHLDRCVKRALDRMADFVTGSKSPLVAYTVCRKVRGSKEPIPVSFLAYEPGPPVYVIRYVGTIPRHRGLGGATKAVESLLILAHQKGADVVAMVHEENNAALKFFRSLDRFQAALIPGARKPGRDAVQFHWSSKYDE